MVLLKVFWKDVLLLYYDSFVGGGYLGIEKVKRVIYWKYYWLWMYSDIVEYVKLCDCC